MLKTIDTINTSSVKRLLRLWEKRYVPQLTSVYIWQDQSSRQELLTAASPEGRALTVTKLHKQIIKIRCELAGLQTNALYSYIPNVVNLWEARRLTQFSYQIYLKILDFYQKPSSTTFSTTDKLSVAAFQSSNVSVVSLGIPAIGELATALEPLLLEFQEQHKASRDWRTAGFMTTQLNLSNQLLLQKLTLAEQVLLKPYLQFVEEQVALPWQRVCAAAAKYSLDSPTLALVEKMLPLSDKIAQKVYQQLTQIFPDHCSRRGGLKEPDVAHSCLRDLNMWQAYLWLSVLEETTTAVEEELLTTCIMVMTGVEVKWELIEQWIKLLMDEIIAQATPSQIPIVFPYLIKIQELFFQRRMRLGASQKKSQ
ncbi:hypothetical protein [Lyngbya aestuarii]|uniref:hypothetical protein n=1 Tax=Lyngbya aestuarii TaxID=118322 RepID=UPI00403DC182